MRPMRPLTIWLRKNWFWLGVNLAAAIPLVHLIWDMAAGNLSVNPIDDITDRTGKAALILLILSLSCTPAHVLFGWRQPLQLRRSLGLWAFAYASFHLLNFVGNDYLFDLRLILLDGVVTKPYVVVGFTAFLLLLPLAITSTKGWMRRLGPRWKTLHKVVYVAAIAVIVHFFWLAKAAEDWEPMIYAVILTALLVVRIPPVRRRIVTFRRALTGSPRSGRSGATPAHDTAGLRARPGATPVPTAADAAAPATPQ